MRSAVKRVVMAGYCWHVIPAEAVKAAFRLFRLKGV